MANGDIPLPRDDDFGLAPSVLDVPPVPAFGESSLPFPPPPLPGLQFIPDPVSFGFGAAPPLTQPGLDVVPSSLGLLGSGLGGLPEAPDDDLLFPPQVEFGAGILGEQPSLLAAPGAAPVGVGLPLGAPPIPPVAVPPFGTSGLDVLAASPPFRPTPGAARVPGALPPAPPSDLDLSLTAVSDLSDQDQELRQTGRQIQLALARESDPTKRAALQAQLADTEVSLQQTQGELGQARAIADEDQAVESQRVENELRKAQRDTVLDARQQAKNQATLDRTADDLLRQQMDIARGAQRTATETHAELVAKSPELPFADTAVAMVTESLRAFNENRPPDFASRLKTLRQQSERRHKSVVDGAVAQIALSGDDVKDIARQRQEAKIQEAARDAAISDRLVLQLDQQIAGAQDEQARQGAIRARDNVRADRDARAAEAAAERAKRARADASLALKDQATRAGIAKTQADTRRALAQAAKLERRGKGRGTSADKLAGLTSLPPALRRLAATGPKGKAAANFQFPRLVVNPLTGKANKRPDGTFAIATTPQVAASLNEGGILLEGVNRLVNQAIVLRGKKGWEPTSKWFASDAGQVMASISTELLLLNKDIFGLGVLSAADEKLLLRIQGGDLTGLIDPRPALKRFRKDMITKYNTRLRTKAPDSPSIQFPQVVGVPRASARNIRIALTQSPDLETGASEPAASRLAKTDELFDVLIEEKKDIRKASEAFTSQVDVITKQSDDHLATINDAITDERTPELVGLEGDVVRAGRDLFLLGTTASGQQVNEARARFDQARIDLSNAQSPKLKSLINQRNEQSSFVVGLKSKSAGQLQRQREAAQREAERERALEQPFSPELFEGQ